MSLIETWQKWCSGSGRKVRVPAGQQLPGGPVLLRVLAGHVIGIHCLAKKNLLVMPGPGMGVGE